MTEEMTEEGGYIYIASPYTSDDPEEQDRRERYAAAFVAAGVVLGIIAYSPVAYSSALRPHAPIDMGTTWEYWKKLCLAMLSQAREVHVLKLPGWAESIGVRAEVKEAKRLGIPVKYVDDISRFEEFGG